MNQPTAATARPADVVSELRRMRGADAEVRSLANPRRTRLQALLERPLAASA